MECSTVMAGHMDRRSEDEDVKKDIQDWNRCREYEQTISFVMGGYNVVIWESGRTEECKDEMD